MFTWYWLADLCADEGIPFVLGHALSMKAIHGGKAKNDKIDAHKMRRVAARRYAPAGLRLSRPDACDPRPAPPPYASGPQTRRAPGPRAATPTASTTCRDRQEAGLQGQPRGVAERCADPRVHKSIAVDLALIDLRRAASAISSCTIVNTAKHHDANTLYLLQTVPGIGTMLSLVLLYEIHDIQRFPRGQDFVSSCRLVKCAKESAGKRTGTAGNKIGNAHLKWAFSEAAVLFLRDHPAAQKYLARLEKKHAKAKP